MANDAFRDYADLQLRFAEAMAGRAGEPLSHAVTWYTNLHRRFGLGVLPPPARDWQAFLTGLLKASDHEARVRWTVRFGDCRPRPSPPPGRHVFGCFACDAPDGRGVVRIHFANRDQDDTSPLADGKVAARRAELAALFDCVRRDYPRALSVRGTSWLYHLAAYRRLFPPDYVASRRVPDSPQHFHGSSSWGQFLDHRGQVKAAPRAALLANLAKLDPGRPGDVFPLPALAVTAPIGAFYDHYPRAAPAP